MTKIFRLRGFNETVERFEVTSNPWIMRFERIKIKVSRNASDRYQLKTPQQPAGIDLRCKHSI